MSISLDQFILFVSVVTLLVVSPGPNLFLLLGTVPGSGRTAGLMAVLGVCSAVVSHATLALLGVGTLIATSALLFTAIKTAGALYLMWMGVRSLLSLRGPAGLAMPASGMGPALSPARAFGRGYLTNILNPKPAIFYVAAFPQFLSPQHPGFVLTGLALALTHALVACLFYGAVVLMMSRLTRQLLRPAVSRGIRSLSGAALILLGGRLLLVRAPT